MAGLRLYSEMFEPQKVGHQEAILDAILLLDDTVREIRFGSLKSTAKKLFEKCLKLQNLRNPMQNDRPIGGHGFPLDTINSSQLSNKVCSIKNRSIFNEVQIRVIGFTVFILI